MLITRFVRKVRNIQQIHSIIVEVVPPLHSRTYSEPLKTITFWQALYHKGFRLLKR